MSLALIESALASTSVPHAGAKAKPGSEDNHWTSEAACDGMIDLVAYLFATPGRELRKPGRNSAEIARLRQIAMYVSHVALQINLTEIGKGFGRDRTTVVHACHLIEDLRDDPDFDRLITRVEQFAIEAFPPKDRN